MQRCDPGHSGVLGRRTRSSKPAPKEALSRPDGNVNSAYNVFFIKPCWWLSWGPSLASVLCWSLVTALFRAEPWDFGGQNFCAVPESKQAGFLPLHWQCWERWEAFQASCCINTFSRFTFSNFGTYLNRIIVQEFKITLIKKNRDLFILHWET